MALPEFIDTAGQLLGLIAVRDELRTEAPAVIQRLRNLGVDSITMLTGDNARTATALARAAGIDDTRAELRPEDKVSAVNELRRHGLPLDPDRPVAGQRGGDGVAGEPVEQRPLLGGAQEPQLVVLPVHRERGLGEAGQHPGRDRAPAQVRT